MTGYFDANATTPLFPEVRERYLEALDESWHNASGLHHPGGAVKRRLEEAREELAAFLGIDDPERVIFLSGATESANVVFRHFAAVTPSGARVAVSPLEHPCVREAAEACFPGRVSELPLDPRGRIDPEASRGLLARERPVLVSAMAANNETGALQPWREIGEAGAALGIPCHCDATQWIGKLPGEALGEIGWITGSAHKFGGPKGVGFLVAPSGQREIRGGAAGGPQEGGRRAGTENVPGILAMVAALRAADGRLRTVSESGRDGFEARMVASIPGTRVVAADAPRLWNTSMLVLPEFPNLRWLTRLSHRGFQVSTGSACSSGKDNPSRVMAAMGLDHGEMGRVLRASALWDTSPEEWSALAGALEAVWEELRVPSASGREKRRIRL